MLSLKSFPADRYHEYRYEAIFKAYKWDPQVGDQNTVAPYALIMPRETAEHLERMTERLARETRKLEEALIKDPSPAKNLGLPKLIMRALPRLRDYNPEKHIRVMRFDFHPVDGGNWAVSEVNSDVPGGFAEASILPAVAVKYFPDCSVGRNAAESLFEAFAAKQMINDKGQGTNEDIIAFVHATAYSDDRQVMQFLSDYFTEHGMKTVFAAPDHIRFEGGKACCIALGAECVLSGIVRFFPLEWLLNLPKNAKWRQYFDCPVPCCNHPAAVFAQSKRLPLVWDKFGVDISAWKELLPETRDPKQMTRDKGQMTNTDTDIRQEWIFKPALGRVGEGISIRGAVNDKEMRKITKLARRRPRDWVAQRFFHSAPVCADDGQKFHLCVGSFAVDGKAAGFYGRLSALPRIDDKAMDVPILIDK